MHFELIECRQKILWKQTKHFEALNAIYIAPFSPKQIKYSKKILAVNHLVVPAFLR